MFNIFIILVIVIVIAAILYERRQIISDYEDPFGKESHVLNNQNGKGKRFRKKCIQMAKEESQDSLKMVTGEFGKGMQGTAKEALENGFRVSVISGPYEGRPEETKSTIYDLLKKYPDKFNFYCVKDRPVHHFSIIGSNLFIEDQHPADIAEDQIRGSFGIINANSKYLNEFDKRFNEFASKAETIRLPPDDEKNALNDSKCFGKTS
jgi:hypothetical protein